MVTRHTAAVHAVLWLAVWQRPPESHLGGTRDSTRHPGLARARMTSKSLIRMEILGSCRDILGCHET
jgi:hypothetical protein